MKSLGVLMWTEGLNASKCMRFKRKSISVEGALVWGYWQVKLFVQVEIYLMKPNGQGLYVQLNSSEQNERKKKITSLIITITISSNLIGALTTLLFTNDCVGL